MKTQNFLLKIESVDSKVPQTVTNSTENSTLRLLKQLMERKVMRTRFIILILNFFINALIFYGLSINSVSLNGNKYLNFILISLIEIPGYKLGLIMMDKYGRKPGFITCVMLCGATCILCGYAELVWLQTILFLVGKLGISATFSILYVHAAELMPTPIRSSSLGLFVTI